MSQKKWLNMKITYLEPYCGGARPSKEMEEEAQRPRPYSGKTIIIVSGSGKVMCARTNDSGFIHVKLKPGSYKVYEEWRYYRQVPFKLAKKDVDMDCLKTEWQKEMATVNITAKDTEITPKNGIVVYCPWAIPCLLDSARPPFPQ